MKIDNTSIERDAEAAREEIEVRYVEDLFDGMEIYNDLCQDDDDWFRKGG